MFCNEDSDIAEVRTESLANEVIDANGNNIFSNATSTIEDNSMPNSIVVDFDNLNDSPTPNAIIDSMSSLRNVAKSKSENVPLNEFAENKDILSGAFPDLFLLGYSFNKKGPLSK